MNIKNQKLVTFAIAFLLLTSVAIPFMKSPLAKAASSSIESYPFIDAVPNPVGVNQQTLLNFGNIQYLMNAPDGWNVTVTYTKPDGTNVTLGDFMTDSSGATGRSFTPDQTGTYIFYCYFKEQSYNGATYTAKTSSPLKLVVQEQPLSYYQGQPLPSQYWTRPIDAQLREWYSIAGSWLAVPPNMYATNEQGPTSAHVLWATPLGDSIGGLAGGDAGDQGYGTGDAYEGKFGTPLIIDGILFYNKEPSYNQGTSPQQYVNAIDIHTGQLLWEKTLLNNQRIAFGQVLDFSSMNYEGAFSYLWVTSGTNWYAFEPLTGDLKYNMTNVPSGTNYYGPNGEILKYTVSNMGNATNPNWRLLEWNSTNVVVSGKTGMAYSWGSQTQGVSFDASKTGYDLNISLPTSLPGSILKVFPGDKVIGGLVTQAQVSLWAISLQAGTQGTILFNNNATAPSEWLSGNLTLAGFCGWDQQNNVGVYLTKENRIYYGFSLTNGQLLWQTKNPEVFQNSWDATSGNRVRALAYGIFYSASIGGTVYAYNDTTGDLIWTYNNTDTLHQGLYGNNWWTIITFIADGKIYIGNADHSPIMPLWRGAPYFCLNATTGQLIWEADGMFRQTFWGGRAIIGDSIIATQDTYDQRIYAIGKGPSSTTVTAPDTAAPLGTPVVIKGTVMDASPGTSSEALKLRFANGVPAVSDDSQSAWMLYVYKQFPAPTNATGVKVSLDAVDGNNNTVHIGDTVTDASGTFSYMFTPQVTGKYIIYATFSGSNSYYGSYAQTALGVAAQPAPSSTVTPLAQAASDPYLLPGIIGVILTIVIVGAALAILITRRK